MEARTIRITFEKAKEWYFSGDSILKELALQAFTKNELDPLTYQQILEIVEKPSISKEEEVIKTLAEYYKKPSDVFKPHYDKWFIGNTTYDGWTVVKHSSVMYAGISYFLREKDAKEALKIFLNEMGYDR